MVVHNFDPSCIALVPFEANPPLVIDANAILPLPITLQSFETIAGRHAQIVQNLRPAARR